MIDSICISAPCKLNLHLRVLARRTDGYHDIESVFQLISLADELTVSISGDSPVCSVVSPFMVLPSVNTITAAVDTFRSATGIAAGITVQIAKRVPSGAGLGGGSSDAAAVLKALDRMFCTRLTPALMADMASRIGSDVPFFLSGRAAVVEGRGEKISPFLSRSDLFGVLVWPDVHSSTAEGYRLVDAAHAEGRKDPIQWPHVSDLAAMYRMPVSGWTFGNSFTAPLEAVYPQIKEAKMALAACGALFYEMSGSGSTVFGLFEDEKAAETAQIMLSSRWKQCVKFLLLAS